MSPSSPPLSVKTPSSSLQPSTTNESLILLFTQIQSMHESIDTIKKDYSDIRTDIKDIYDRISDIEMRLAIEERDKKIIIGFIAVGLPLILTAIQLFIN